MTSLYRCCQIILCGLCCAVIFPGTMRAAVLNFYLVGSTCADAHYSADLTGNKMSIYNPQNKSYLSRFYFDYQDLNLEVQDVPGYSSLFHPTHLPELYAPPMQAKTSFQLEHQNQELDTINP
mgnify:CR=1 FL=1